jgi:hypothetical protein
MPAIRFVSGLCTESRERAVTQTLQSSLESPHNPSQPAYLLLELPDFTVPQKFVQLIILLLQKLGTLCDSRGHGCAGCWIGARRSGVSAGWQYGVMLDIRQYS